MDEEEVAGEVAGGLGVSGEAGEGEEEVRGCGGGGEVGGGTGCR